MTRRDRPLFLVTLAAALTIVLVASACGDGGGGASSSTPPPTTGGSGGASGLVGNWILSSYRQNAEPVDAATPAATLRFVADGSLQGFTGCNTFTGTWTLAGIDELTLALGAMTMAACPEGPLVFQERAVTTNLPQVGGYEVIGDSLTLKAPDGNILFTYNRGAEGVVGTWKVTGVNNGNGAVVGTTATEALSIQFSPDGTVSGNSGCNTFSGTYTASGQQLTIGQLASTLRACADPDVGAVEAQFLAALPKVASWEQSGQTVTLRDSTGATQVVLVPAA